MNAPHDLDRDLADWLGDGPTRSSDQPIDAALAHAQRDEARPEWVVGRFEQALQELLEHGASGSAAGRLSP